MRTRRIQRDRAVNKRVEKSRSSVETLNNSPDVNRVPRSDTVKEPLRENSKLDIGA